MHVARYLKDERDKDYKNKVMMVISGTYAGGRAKEKGKA